MSGCESTRGPAFQAAKSDEKVFSQKLREPKYEAGGEGTIIQGTEAEEQSTIQVFNTPTLSVEEAAEQAKEAIVPTLGEKSVSRLTFNNMPIGTFINEVYGNQLGLNFIVEPNIKNASDFVTLRISTQIDQLSLFELATETLRTYGVTTSLRGEVLTFSYSEDAADGRIPLLASGSTLPEIPSGNRPVFHFYPLKSVSTPQVRGWLNQLFPKRELEIKEDVNRNALIFSGLPRIVRQALAATRLLDQPSMQGMYSRIIRPNLSSVDDLANNLEKVLKAEGYSVRQRDGATAIRLLPLESVDQLVIFARSPDVLDHIVEWASTLETEHQNRVESGIFSYKVQNTQATHIVEILNNLGVAQYSGSSKDGKNSDSESQNKSRQVQVESSAGRYAVNEQLNTILYSGSGKSWMQALPVIKSMDKPSPSVLVEVILVELLLKDTEQSGIDWLASASLGKYGLDFGFGSPANAGGSGLNFSLLSGTDVKAAINLFYNSTRSSIRSRPRLMVKSGGEASIDVGDEVPIITTSSQSTTSPDAPIVQNVSYRNTGVLLNVKPTVHASGFIDIEVRQELSEAVGTTSSEIDSPTITNRKMETTVTLRDGGAVLLGGLISSTNSDGEDGVPGLGTLPAIGKLFRNDTLESRRTELMIMIIPYVLNSPEEAENLTDELQWERINQYGSSDGADW
ncbi:type II secretion system protein GspD [Neiella sp. HB171785]|uniref:Type II secretion system protein GspD n=1 Tax=Neiella litorisoli TaxID=2771431 RepID=A0A8J6QHL0_9GAMM|nr:type II secretion system protein GspD [Neiella litorisoli]